MTSTTQAGPEGGSESGSGPLAGTSLDLNADVGESFGRWRLGDDAGLMPLLTSANIACGFHAGDPVSLLDACRGAVQNGVSIGAQVGYHDLVGFGRRFIDVAPEDLYADVLYQLGALDGLARTAGGRMRYVKPHGALYNAVVHHHGQADAVVRAVRDYDPTLAVLGLPGSVLLATASAAGLRTVSEAFADRAYAADGTLLARGRPGAVLTDPETVGTRVLQLVTEQRLVAADGTELHVVADSVCLHGDTPGAVALARSVRDRLTASGITLRAFATP